jgi:hypothetical protein
LGYLVLVHVYDVALREVNRRPWLMSLSKGILPTPVAAGEGICDTWAGTNEGLSTAPFAYHSTLHSPCHCSFYSRICSTTQFASKDDDAKGTRRAQEL